MSYSSTQPSSIALKVFENDDALIEVARFHLFEHRPFVFVKGKIAFALG